MTPELDAPPQGAGPAAAAPTGRPAGATAIAIIAAVEAGLLLFAAIALVLFAGDLGRLLGAAGSGSDLPGVGPIFPGVGILVGVMILAIGLVFLAVAYGVWRARRWSWLLGVVVYALALIVGVQSLGGGLDAGRVVAWIAIPVLVLVLLWRPEVRRYLGGA